MSGTELADVDSLLKTELCSGCCMVMVDVVLCMAAESAKQFVQQRMFGRGVKRSAEMLIPSTARYYGPAVNF